MLMKSILAACVLWNLANPIFYAGILILLWMLLLARKGEIAEAVQIETRQRPVGLRIGR